MTKLSGDARLARVIQTALALPEAGAEQTGPLCQHTTFRVRRKTFAYYVVDEHGDGRVAILCKTVPGMQASLAASNPARHFVPKYIGPRGWVDSGKTDWAEIACLITESYRLVAPKRLVALVEEHPQA